MFSQALNALKTGFVDTFNKTEGPMKDMAIRLRDAILVAFRFNAYAWLPQSVYGAGVCLNRT